jgi:predicted ribosomally synthesized peptide with nif11-like leader
VRKWKIDLSRDTLAALIAALQKEETLRTRFAECKRPEDVIDIAKAAGYKINLQDLTEAQKKSSLSEAELDTVAGGTIGLTILCTSKLFSCSPPTN